MTKAKAAALIAVAIMAAYCGILRAPFIFDDRGSILENPSIRHLASAFEPPFSEGQTVGGRPVVNLSLAVNYALSGYGVLSYHLFNLGVHFAAALVLFGLVRRTLVRLRWSAADSLWTGFAAALIWAVHPLQTEAVTYVVQRAESLMGLFYLLTLYCFVRATNPTGSMVCVAEASKAFVASQRTGPETLGAFRYTSHSSRLDWIATPKIVLS